VSKIESAVSYFRLRHLANLVWPGHPSRWRDVPRRLRPSAVNILRLTAAAVFSYLLTLAITSGAVDLTGPLTALLVMQAVGVLHPQDGCGSGWRSASRRLCCDPVLSLGRPDVVESSAPR
jgi:hypothetical protein